MYSSGCFHLFLGGFEKGLESLSHRLASQPDHALLNIFVIVKNCLLLICVFEKYSSLLTSCINHFDKKKSYSTDNVFSYIKYVTL